MQKKKKWWSKFLEGSKFLRIYGCIISVFREAARGGSAAPEGGGASGARGKGDGETQARAGEEPGEGCGRGRRRTGPRQDQRQAVLEGRAH